MKKEVLRKKVVRIGKLKPEWSRTRFDVFCRIELRPAHGVPGGTKLSICGVEGPKRHGNAVGGCGQITLAPAEEFEFAPGWNAETLDTFREVWNRWHLNDMRAGCEHQRTKYDPTRKVTIVTWRLTDEALKQKTDVRRHAERQIETTGKVKLSPEQHTTYTAPFELKLAEGIAPHLPLYVEKSREAKAIGWLHENEHAEGILGKPCEVCGYKYGSAWLHEPLPEHVVEFLFTLLPDTDVTPAWV